MFDLNILRKQFEYRIANWKRSVILIRFGNYAGGEYLHDQESTQKEQTIIEIFLTTQNSNAYRHDALGNLLERSWHAYASWNTNVMNNDIIQDGNIFYKVFNLADIYHPVFNEAIGKEFDLQKIEIDSPEE